ncbi:MAG: hypothetical protein ACTSQK_02965 [Candidatus Heimdallarchaeota archaeon]
MKIKDENGKIRKVSEIKKIEHKILDTNGGEVIEEYVEATIEGKRSQWKEWYHYPNFKRLNPEIEI